VSVTAGSSDPLDELCVWFRVDDLTTLCLPFLVYALFHLLPVASMISGSLLGGIVSVVLRASLTHQQLISWGWRIPFVSGIFVSLFGFYLKSHGGDHDGHHYQRPDHGTEEVENGGNGAVASGTANGKDSYAMDEAEEIATPPLNPLLRAFSQENLRPLLAASMVPMLWSAGFYLSFVWMAIFMADLIEDPVPGAFAVNSASLLFSVCLLFPVAGILSDRFGRVRIMTIGCMGMGTLSPVLVLLIGRGNPFLAFFAQSMMGVSLSFFGAPMCAWLVEAFEPEARLTSVSIGYNVAQAIAGGTMPFLATLVVDNVGPASPGWILTILAVVALTGLLCVAPSKANGQSRRCHNFVAVQTDTITSDVAEEGDFEMVGTATLNLEAALDDDDNELL
jgi:MFS transporter, MHS family, proline/betaine transporter